MKLPTTALALFFLSATLLPVAGAHATSQHNPSPADAASHPAVIRSHAELTQYVAVTPADQSPLSLLPPGARKRFLATLVWGQNGLGGFDKSDLAQYLTSAEIRQILALFGLTDYPIGDAGRAKPLTAAERHAPETPLEHSFDKYYFARAGAFHGRPHPSAGALYKRLLAPRQDAAKLATLDDSDVGLLYRATRDAVFDSGAARYLDDLRLDLAELARRGLATTAMITDVHDALVAARDFTQANAFAGRYPDAHLARLPPLHRASDIGNGEPTVLLVEPDGKSLLRRPVDMDGPLRIVVVAGCHFSVDAVRAIRADSKLQALFHDHAVWLAPESESLSDVLEWNRDYPDQPMNVAWRNREWTMLDSWAIPTFYIFRHGKLTDQWSGWPADTGLGTLRTHLRRVGLID